MEEKQLNRVKPHSKEAEAGVLGCMLLDGDALATGLSRLKEDDFYTPVYGKLFSFARALYSKGEPVDLITMGDEMAKAGGLTQENGMEVLRSLYDSEPTSVNIGKYCDIVKDASTKRKIIKATEELIARSYDPESTARSCEEMLEKAAFDIHMDDVRHDPQKIDVVAEKAIEEILNASKIKGNVIGVPSGFTDLDELTGGFMPGDLVILAGRPSMGKTALALNFLYNMCYKYPKKAMMFSLEMTNVQLVKRLLSMDSGISGSKMKVGNLTEQEWSNLISTKVRLENGEVTLDDTSGATVSDIRAKCRKQKVKEGLDAIVIDYLQLMSSEGKRENRQQEISEISRGLKGLAKEMECPVIVLSQLSRASEIRGGDHRPQLSDLRESGAIEQDADIVMFIHRDEYYNKDSERQNQADIIVAKQRNGAVDDVAVFFDKQTTSFKNLDHHGYFG